MLRGVLQSLAIEAGSSSGVGHDSAHAGRPGTLHADTRTSVATVYQVQRGLGILKVAD